MLNLIGTYECLDGDIPYKYFVGLNYNYDVYEKEQHCRVRHDVVFTFVIPAKMIKQYKKHIKDTTKIDITNCQTKTISNSTMIYYTQCTVKGVKTHLNRLKKAGVFLYEKNLRFIKEERLIEAI